MSWPELHGYPQWNPRARPHMGKYCPDVEGAEWLLLRTSIESHRRGDGPPVTISPAKVGGDA